MEAPCPVCGTPVRAPRKPKPEPAWLELPVEFWTEPVPEPAAPPEPAPAVPAQSAVPAALPAALPVPAPAALPVSMEVPARVSSPGPAVAASLEASPPEPPEAISPLGPIRPIRPIFPQIPPPRQATAPLPPAAPAPKSAPIPGVISRILKEARSEEKRPVPPDRRKLKPLRRTPPVFFPKAAAAQVAARQDDPQESDFQADDRREEDLREDSAAGTRRFRLRFFDAALVCLFLGTVAVGAAAVAFTQSRQATVPPAPPELSRLVVERMQDLDRRRDASIQSARQVLERLMVTPDAGAAESLLTPAGWDGAAGLQFPLFAGSAPADFEFIQARRIPGTERFLTLFELAADPPLVIPVEETPDGSRMHGMAVAQQTGGRLGKFLASQGQGEAVFYVLLRPAPAAMEADLLKSRPDLAAYRLVGAEPAFPGDGASGCLVAITPGSPVEAVFGKRAHDPGLRPAVVRLAWRQHRESGNYVELTGFVENAWSRH